MTWNYRTEHGADGTIESPDAATAAEEAWEAICHRTVEYWGGEIEIWADGERKKTFVVTVESVPVFSASEKS